jgi:hypothetical protein
MTCNFKYDEDGSLTIICSRNDTPSEIPELKKAMVCKRRVKCEECESHEICRRVLVKRKEML